MAPKAVMFARVVMVAGVVGVVRSVPLIGARTVAIAFAVPFNVEFFTGVICGRTGLVQASAVPAATAPKHTGNVECKQ